MKSLKNLLMNVIFLKFLIIKIELKSKHIELYTDVDNVTNLSPNKGGIVNEKIYFAAPLFNEMELKEMKSILIY